MKCDIYSSVMNIIPKRSAHFEPENYLFVEQNQISIKRRQTLNNESGYYITFMGLKFIFDGWLGLIKL